MATMTLQIETPSLFEHLKSVLSIMKGVKIISDSETLSEIPSATTLSAMKEAESGCDAGTVQVDTLEHFMASFE